MHTLTMALAASLIGVPASSQGQEAVRPAIAVLDFTNGSLVDHASYEPFTAGVAAMLLTDLARNERIQVVERERLREVLAEQELATSGRVDPETAARAGKLVGAQHIVFGVFVIDRRGRLRIDARAVNVETSRVEHVETVEDDADDLLRAVGRLGRQLSDGLRLPGRSGRPADAGPAAQRGQVLANLKYARALIEEDRRQPATAVSLYQEFLTDSPPGYAPALRKAVEERIRVLSGGR